MEIIGIILLGAVGTFLLFFTAIAFLNNMFDNKPKLFWIILIALGAVTAFMLMGMLIHSSYEKLG